jgi:hypothetical protein
VSYPAPDVYNNPEKFGLEQVAQIDYSDGCYEFDYRVVWLHRDTGKLYTARDSGCSCPSPFEEYTSIQYLEEFSLVALENEVKNERAASRYRGDEIGPFLQDIRSLERK